MKINMTITTSSEADPELKEEWKNLNAEEREAEKADLAEQMHEILTELFQPGTKIEVALVVQE